MMGPTRIVFFVRSCPLKDKVVHSLVLDLKMEIKDIQSMLKHLSMPEDVGFLLFCWSAGRVGEKNKTFQ